MISQLEDFPIELLLSIFDYFWAHELYSSFANLNQRLDRILTYSFLHISSENQDNIIYSPERVLSLILTSSPICLDDFQNLRSLTLNKCNPTNLLKFPSTLSRLCIANTQLTDRDLKLILETSNLTNVQLKLHHKITFTSTLLNINQTFCNIEYLTINYISLNDLVQLINYTRKLKYLHVSLFSIDHPIIANVLPLPTVNRLICLSMGISFDILCSQFLSIYFPKLEHLSVFTSFVKTNSFVKSLETLLINDLCSIKKLNISAQFLINRSLTANSNQENIETIAMHFRTAFWIKRNCRTTFRYCNNDPHTIRLYLQTNKKPRTRPSRFEN